MAFFLWQQWHLKFCYPYSQSISSLNWVRGRVVHKFSVMNKKKMSLVNVNCSSTHCLRPTWKETNASDCFISVVPSLERQFEERSLGVSPRNPMNSSPKRVVRLIHSRTIKRASLLEMSRQLSSTINQPIDNLQWIDKFLLWTWKQRGNLKMTSLNETV